MVVALFPRTKQLDDWQLKDGRGVTFQGDAEAGLFIRFSSKK